MRYLAGLAAGLPLTAGLLLAAGALRRRFVLITVTGDSMMPTLTPGDRVLVRRARIDQLRRGQIVVLEMPGAGGRGRTPPARPVPGHDWMIKRVAALPGDPVPESCRPDSAGAAGQRVPDGKLIVLGDNAAWSTDSRQLGYLPAERLLGFAMGTGLAGSAPFRYRVTPPPRYVPTATRTPMDAEVVAEDHC
jgi:signal peptidase I